MKLGLIRNRSKLTYHKHLLNRNKYVYRGLSLTGCSFACTGEAEMAVGTTHGGSHGRAPPGTGKPVRADVGGRGREGVPPGRRVGIVPCRCLAALSRGMVLARRHGNLRPAGGRGAGSGGRVGPAIPPGLSPPPREAPGTSYSLFPAALRGCAVGPPPHPGRAPEALTRRAPRESARGSWECPWGHGTAAGGDGCEVVRAELLGREGRRWSCPAVAQSSEPLERPKERCRPGAGALGRRGEPAPPHGTGRGARCARNPVPGKHNGRADARPLLQPTRGFPPGCVCLLDLCPCRRPRPPLAARVWSRTAVGGVPAAGKSLPATRE
ncbi:vasodilator-stimulated phosphoprotein-like [Pseudopipra pipra]|uniref:vasodilator-stimulated phosphoprotein-like n=1 Tax=Pseudopipra pipra TaxID=415032 RepID=UPI003139AB9B